MLPPVNNIAEPPLDIVVMLPPISEASLADPAITSKFPLALATTLEPSFPLESPPITLISPVVACPDVCATMLTAPTEPALPVFNVSDPGILLSEDPLKSLI